MSAAMMTIKEEVDSGRHECEPDNWAESDARGIYLCRVCERCVSVKLAGYRSEVLSDSSYDCDEPIEPDDY